MARPSLYVEVEDSLALASTRMIENGRDVLPVLKDDQVVGILTGESLVNALGDAIEPTDSVRPYMKRATMLRGYATGAEALRCFSGGSALVVIDDDNRLIGLLSPADLFPRQRPQLRPPLVGGVATPFGVYLTSGGTGSGVPMYVLASSGAAITLMFSAAILLGYFGGIWLKRNGLSTEVTENIQVAITVLLFAVLFKLTPLAGIHGAEHQVVHAIEREVELTPSAVRRMPLVHPRCGTNYSVAVSLFLGLFGVPWGSDEVRLIIAIVGTLILWRPLGKFAQKYITTKRPSEKQLNQAIAAGKELLRKYEDARISYPDLARRIWNTGLFFIIIGSVAMAAAIGAVAQMFQVNIVF